MGQGPQYLLIGNGRVSRHMQRYLRWLHLSFRVWTRAGEQPLETALRGVTHVLLAISDDAIVPFLESQQTLLESRVVVHFSGSLATPLAWGAHPLMTFSGNSCPPEEYAQIHFVFDAGAPEFAQLLPGFPNPHHRLAAEQKPLYHALCVLSGNFTSILWNHFFEALETQLGIPREAAIPYLRRVAANLEGAEHPVTGPLARRDKGTVRRNLQALAGDPYQEVYSSFVHAYAPGLS